MLRQAALRSILKKGLFTKVWEGFEELLTREATQKRWLNGERCVTGAEGTTESKQRE